MSGQVQRRNAQMVELNKSDFVSSPWGCAFLAFNTMTDTLETGNGLLATVDFDTEIYDLGDDFAADTFTAPADGAYPLTATVTIESLTAAMTSGQIHLVTSNRTYLGALGNWGAMRTPGNLTSVTISVRADMNAGDTAIVQVLIANGVGDTAGFLGHATVLYTYFSGHRVI